MKTNASKPMLIMLLFLLTSQPLYAFYDPQTQRWINRDPLGDNASSTRTPKQHFTIDGPTERVQRPNLLTYDLNSPLAFSDPYGQFVDPTGNVSQALDTTYDGMLGCGLRIKNEVWDTYGRTRGENDPSARLAHCIAHCRITRECLGGPATSYLGGLAKELEDWVIKLLFRKGEGYDSWDMKANALGRKFAGCKDKSCEEQCQGALSDGSLYPSTAVSSSRN